MLKQLLNNGIYTAYEYLRPPLSVTPIRIFLVNKRLFATTFVMWFCVLPLLCCTVLKVSSSFAIIWLRKRQSDAFLKLSFLCHVAVIGLSLLLKVPSVGLQCVILAFPGHTHFTPFLCSYDTFNQTCYFFLFLLMERCYRCDIFFNGMEVSSVKDLEHLYIAMTIS